MKSLNLIGKIVIALGIISVFRKVEGFYGFGGYVDNSWEIIIVSLAIIVIGITLIFISKKHTFKKQKRASRHKQN
jgi:uncharacterized membrane protein